MGERGIRDGHRYDDAAWRSLATGVAGVRRGYASIKRDDRGFPLFVAASGLSDASCKSYEEESSEQPPGNSSSPLPAQISEASEQERHIGSQPKSASLDSAGESMATLYARLVASTTEKPIASGSKLIQEEDISKIMQQRLPRQYSGKISAPDWFIRRAIQRKDQQRFESEVTSSELAGDITSAPSEPVQCAICQTVVLSGSNAAVMSAHQGSIAHQLALNSLDGPARSMGSSAARRHTAEAAQPYRDRTIVLKNSNIGYMALERMGWRVGMGLGRNEWEVARLEAMKRSKAASQRSIERATPVKKITESFDEDRASMIDVTEDESDEEQRIDDVESPSATLEGATSTTEADASSNVAPKRRADVLLEPVPLHVRPDRRGIGIKLPASARVRDRPRPAVATKQSHEQHKHEHNRTKKLSRAAQHKRDRAEWLALRASLNE